MFNEYLILMKSEWMVTAIIFILLFIKLGKGIKNETLLPVIQLLLLLNAVLAFIFNKTGALFGSMYQTSDLIGFEKGVLSLAVYIISLVSSEWLRRQEHLAEFFMLMLSALLGMFFMISSANLLMFYLSLELSTIPVAAMANFDLHKKVSSEAAMKMILSSAFSSGILLFGISLFYGAAGTISFAEISPQLMDSPLFILSFVMLVSGFAFKLSAVPFHLWTADVYEGSPIAVTSFLSVVSKGAIAFVFISVLYKVFGSMQHIWYYMIILLSLLTIIVGNLFAIRQNNIKRFLAFSSITQAGFILVGISSSSYLGTASVVYFVLIYVFSNLAAFGVADLISSTTGRETIESYKGLYGNNKMLGWIMALALFSLAGIPPLAGFFGKFFLIMAGASTYKVWFIAIVALNMMVSLYYYLKVVRAMFMDQNDSPVEKIVISYPVRMGLIICTAAIVLIGMMGWIYEYIAGL